MTQKVLLIDDEQDFLDAMSGRMAARNIIVKTASSAQEAMDIIRIDTFDAVILDYQLPETDGLSALKLIKGRRPDIQIILLTGFATLEKRTEAIKMGAMDLLEKPVDLSVLSEKIRQAKKATLNDINKISYILIVTE